MYSSVLDRLIALLVNQKFILSKGYIQLLYNEPLSVIFFTIWRTRWVVMLHNQMGQSRSNNTTTLLTTPLSFSIPSEAIFSMWSSWRTSKKTVNLLRWLSGNKSLNKNVQIRSAVCYRKKEIQHIKQCSIKPIFNISVAYIAHMLGVVYHMLSVEAHA